MVKDGLFMDVLGSSGEEQQLPPELHRQQSQEGLVPGAQIILIKAYPAPNLSPLILLVIPFSHS